jgi:hypothetical protein
MKERLWLRVEADHRVEIEALQHIVTETKESLNDEISKCKAIALEFPQ